MKKEYALREHTPYALNIAENILFSDEITLLARIFHELQAQHLPAFRALKNPPPPQLLQKREMTEQLLQKLPECPRLLRGRLLSTDERVVLETIQNDRLAAVHDRKRRHAG